MAADPDRRDTARQFDAPAAWGAERRNAHAQDLTDAHRASLAVAT